MTDDELSYEGIEEADLVLALYHHTDAVGMGMLHDRPSLTAETVREDLAARDIDGDGVLRFDYYYGRPLKIALDTRAKRIRRAWLYDRDARATCASVLDWLRR